MGIAEFIIGRAFARPVGSTHPTCYVLDRLHQPDPVQQIRLNAQGYRLQEHGTHEPKGRREAPPDDRPLDIPKFSKIYCL
jgi:hypothetical protein